MAGDPYRELGVAPDASDGEVRAAYRQLVKRHHPDHNGGSAEAARRFEAVQEAYAEIQRRRGHGGPTRATGTGTGSTAPPPGRAPGASAASRTGGAGSTTPPPGDPDFEGRLADLERDVRRAHQAQAAAVRARDRAREAARQAAMQARRAAGSQSRASDEELGYVTTDDTVGKILADARDQLTERYAHAREHPVVRRVSDLIAGLEDLADGLDRQRRH